jgi:hypothetical protein
MKRLLSFLLTFALFSMPVFAGSFPDVPEDHPNYEAIELLDDRDIVSGYEDKTFGPENLVNRAEAMKMIIEALEIDTNSDYSPEFDDVNEDDWHFKYVMTAKELGIVEGYDDGEFKPGDAVNLAETLKMLLLAAEVELEEKVEYDLFTDVDNDAWFAPHMAYAREKNIILADDDGAVFPAKDMTRAAFAEVVYRLIYVLENNYEAFPLDANWTYFTSDALPFKMKYDDVSWEIIENENEVVFFKADNDLLQFSPVRIYPNSAVVRVQLDVNSETVSREDYFDTLKTVFTGSEIQEFELNGLKAVEFVYPEDRIVDWYIYLADNSVLVVYTQYGPGILGYQLQQYVKSMLSTLEYSKIVEVEVEDFSELLSEILSNILVEDAGLDMMEKLPDGLIIETDAIGVGTGPVDYYYSEKLDYTFKYERDSDIILDTRMGETTAF